MPKSSLTGSRIREHRLMKGLKQADLARLSGISASYLNLIEHNRRRIGGKTLLALAEILQVDPSQLSQGAEHSVVSELQNAAASEGAAVELDQIDDLVTRFPGWAAKIMEQHRRLQALEQTVGGLNDRLTHDPVLSDKMHEVLSTVSAIRSTASILVGNPDLDADWQSRFYSNIDTESRRLAESSETMAAHLERLSRPDEGGADPLEALFAALDGRGHHISELEQGGETGVVLDALGLADTNVLAEGYLQQYKADAVSMPLDAFMQAAQEANFDPSQLAAAFDAPLEAVLRRLASLPRSPMRPDIGIVTCDAAGAILSRKSPSGLSMPRFGAGCALWPLFTALSVPGRPLRRDVQSDSGAEFAAYAVAHLARPASFDAPPLYHATMLLVGTEAGQSHDPLKIGASCRVCAHSGCHARREPSASSGG